DSLKKSGKGKGEDESGDIIQKKLKEEGYSSERIIISDEDEEIRKELSKSSKNPEIDALITTGGTGITSRDRTVDVVKELFEKELPGFGELMRSESYEEVGKAAFLSRTTAGIVDKKPIFCLPGSPNSVRNGMKIIIPELAHTVKHARE
ncbi:hypothetical protein AKJ64_04610, partial [candidate division MSBL1 archaeon SCGC-AAA259E17]